MGGGQSGLRSDLVSGVDQAAWTGGGALLRLRGAAPSADAEAAEPADAAGGGRDVRRSEVMDGEGPSDRRGTSPVVAAGGGVLRRAGIAGDAPLPL
jgi:hypothetical protein